MVYITCSSCDKEIADKVVASFESWGFSCFYSMCDLPVVIAEYLRKTRAIMKECDGFIPIMSSNSINNEMFRKEIHDAYKFRLAVIPLFIEDIVLDEALKFEFSTTNWIKAVGTGFDSGMERLHSTVRYFLKHEHLESTRPAAGNVPVPYKGTESYIFASYAHKDMGIVYPIIQQMMNMGIRIWFDDAIAPGSQWPDYIAQHIDECDAFIAFVSKNYLASDNCKDELEYSRDLNKDRLLIYLEEVKLPSGMAMRMNRLQAINWYTYVSQKDFNSILMECPFIGRNMTGGASADTSAPKDEAPGEDSCKDPEKVHREEQTETKKENGEKPSLWKKFFGR